MIRFGSISIRIRTMIVLLASLTLLIVPNCSGDLNMPSHTVSSVAPVNSGAQGAMASSVIPSPVFQNQFEVEYGLVWALINRHFLYRDRLSHWGDWRDRFRGRLNNQAQANAAIDEMVGFLHDQYTYYRDCHETARREAEDVLRNVVSSKILPGGIGYIHLSTFNSRNCVDEIKDSLRILGSQRAYILDLRGNGGGSIDNAMQIFTMFAGSGKFVRMVEMTEGQRIDQEWLIDEDAVISTENGVSHRSFRHPNLIAEKPLVVLVDKTTRSAAEMLAGALHDSRHACVIGSRTYGKGIIQRIWQFAEGTSVKITAARYYLPSGRNIDKVGLQPDLNVPLKAKIDMPVKVATERLMRLSRSNRRHRTG